MTFKIFVFTLNLIITNALTIIHSYAQDSNETILNINERILNRMDGLTTKINDLERKVYQGKDIALSSPENNTISNASDLKKIAGHERRLLELEERDGGPFATWDCLHIILLYCLGICVEWLALTLPPPPQFTA